MAKAANGKKFLTNGSTVHPLSRNGKIGSNENLKSDNISIKSISTISSNIAPSSKSKLPPSRQEDHRSKVISPPTVIITDINDDEAELKSSASDNTELKNKPVTKLPNGFASKNNAASKWLKAKAQVQKVVVVTQALQRPETREEKVRKQIYGSKASLPVLPVPAAVTLLIMNCVFPGLGTITAGFTFCCCGTTYDKPDRKEIWDKVPGLVCRNIFVGLAQILTVSFLLVGWFWSIAWGITMVQFAVAREREKKEGSDWFPKAID